MSWTYHQSTGKISHDGKPVSGQGYAGNGLLKNNPGGETRKGQGPLPRGTYAIAGYYVQHPSPGGHVLQLTPSPGSQMFGRSGFLIHGDSIRAPGTASSGSIVLPLAVRQKIMASGDRALVVVK